MARVKANSYHVPPGALVVLIGAPGSGKSTFARLNWSPTQIVSADNFRAMLTNDANNQQASEQAFDLLRRVVGYRLWHGLLTVVDNTNTSKRSREDMLIEARAANQPAVVFRFDCAPEICIARQLERDRKVPESVIRKHCALLAATGDDELRAEGFAEVWRVGDSSGEAWRGNV